MLELGFTGGPTGIFAENFFTRRIRVALPSTFIKAMHPKTEIRPHAESIRKILEKGWVGQLKIHGHRAQLHVPADPKLPVIAYTRQGKTHGKPLPPKMQKEIRRVFAPETGWNVLDAEWLKPAEKIFVFDILKKDGEVLRKLPYPERWKLLRRDYLSPYLQTLPLIKDVKGCLEALERPEAFIEGLVFKSSSTPGFSDTSIIRCRR